MIDKPLAEREQLEGFYTARRITELRLFPVQGNFDAAHLKEINRRIFQDLPSHGFDDVTPGVYRPAVPQHLDWVKHRTLEGSNVTSRVCYSNMDEAAIARLDDVLKQADPAALRGLKTAAFTQQLAKLYTELDYIHPFSDGNSRTLREFTRELAEASGYQVSWEYFAKTPGARDVLYVARDLSVNALALPHIKSDTTKRDVVFTLDQLEGNRDLPALLGAEAGKIIRPSRAAAFQRLPAKDALITFPELEPAYHALRKADAYSVSKFPDNAEQRRQFQENVRAVIQDRLNSGEVNKFDPPARLQQRSKDPPSPGHER